MFQFHQRELGICNHEEMDNVIYNKTLNEIRGMQIYNEKRIFPSRTTCLKWHPNNESLLILGSKHGTVISWDVTRNLNGKSLNNEIGPGYCITSINMSPSKLQNIIYTSVNGCAYSRDIHTDKTTVILNSSQFSRWYSCSTISLVNDLLLVGDNFGEVTIMDTENGNNLTKIGHLHLHTGRINDMEFCPWDDYLIATASSDFTVCLWDYRLLLAKLSSLESIESPRRDALCTLSHKSGVSSARFNLHRTLSNRERYLVTIDQMREIRIYQECGIDRSQPWICTQIIVQHHRFYHHKTPFNVDWHPNSNLIVVGHLGTSQLLHCLGDKPKDRALEEEIEPTIDVIRSSTGRVIHKFNPSMPQICSTLNCFSHNGSYLASTSCFDVVIRATEKAVNKPKPTDRLIRNRGL